jgi:hypothetical protein
MTQLIAEPNYVRIPLRVEDARVGREIVLAERADNAKMYVLRSIPAFIYGLAPGDHLELLDAESGEFVLRKRGGYVAARVYLEGTLNRPEIVTLIDTIVEAGGKYEIGFNRDDPSKTSLLLVCFRLELGLEVIQAILCVIDKIGGEWEYVNVYDENGELLLDPNGL